MKLRTALLVLLVPLAASCSATPGDAASRSGHPQQAAELYRRGAEQGDGEAALKLGLLVDVGSVKAESFGTSGRWFVKACDLGNVVGCHNAGVGFEYGQSGFEKNYEQARIYLLSSRSRA